MVSFRSAYNCVCPAVAALWLGEWGFFLGPVHRCRAGGRVHRDTAPIMRRIRDDESPETCHQLHSPVTTILSELIESTGIWPQGLLDAYIAMISKADGDSAPLGQRPLSVLPVVYRLWASLRLGHLREWVEGWLPKSVYSLGNGSSSVEAWFSTALDIEEVLSGTGGDQLHVMVADVIKSFDAVDRSILDCVLGRLCCLTGSVRFIFLSTVMFVFGLSLQLVLVSHGVEMVVFPKAVV